MDGYKHYIRVDADANVIHAFSDAFEQPGDGDILVTEEGGRHFNLEIWYNGVIPRWHVEGDEMIERMDEELLTLWDRYQVSHPPVLSETDLLRQENLLLKAQISAQSERSDFIEDLIAELATQVYQ